MFVSVAMIALFIQNILKAPYPTKNGSKIGNSQKDLFITVAPDIKRTNRIPPLERKDPVVGNPDGEITIIEYADFECQYCAEEQSTIDALLRVYPDKIRLVWKNFPLAHHSYSKKAAEAALCANEQKKFTQMRDKLFEKQAVSLLPSNVKEYAKDIKLDAEKFNACFDGGLNEDAVARDVAAANQFAVTGVPHFFIYRSADSSSGYSMPWAGKSEEFKGVIDALLNK